jgi:hypothetical protein
VSNFSLSSWKELYALARLESDKGKLTELVQAAEQVIASRTRQLLDSSNHDEERSEMAAANAALLSMKTNKLGWPAVSARDGLC